jgi:hypothetical protein
MKTTKSLGVAVERVREGRATVLAKNLAGVKDMPNNITVKD